MLWAAECVFVAPRQADLGRFDSLLARAERLRPHLTPAEQHQLDFVRALRTVDFRAAYVAARLRWEGSPASDDALRELAISAARLRRLREASALFARIDPDRGLMRRSGTYWRYLTWLQHQRGDFAGELRSAAEWAQRAPDSFDPEAPMLEGFAALGQADEVRALASRLVDRLADGPELVGGGAPANPGYFGSALAPFEIGARELNEHGKPAAAQALARDGISHCGGRGLTPAQLRPQFRLSCANLLGFVGRWREADVVLRGMIPPDYLRGAHLTYAGMAAARLGDRMRALAFSDSLARLPLRTTVGMVTAPSIEYERAMIAAALGDREGALQRLRLWRAAGDWDPYKIHSEAVFKPYFSDARFRNLLESED